MNIPSNILTLIVGIALTLISLWYGQNHGLMPVAASAEATEVDGIFNLMMTISTGLFLLIEGVLVVSLIRFRRRKGDQTDGPAIEGNVPLEIFWTAIPTVIVFILAVYSFEVYNDLGGLDPMVSGDRPSQQVAAAGGHHHDHMMALSPHSSRVALGIGTPTGGSGGVAPMMVDVKGIQYAWIFTYPETGIVAGELHVPIGRPVQLNLTAGDVIHAFWLPEFRIKQDTIPGRESTLGFTANRLGNYPIICAELCGAYHGGMKSVLYVQSEEDYNKWVQENTLAQGSDENKTVAVNPASLSDGDFLAPYAEEMGIEATTLAQVHSSPHHHHGSL